MPAPLKDLVTQRARLEGVSVNTFVRRRLEETVKAQSAAKTETLASYVDNWKAAGEDLARQTSRRRAQFPGQVPRRKPRDDSEFMALATITRRAVLGDTRFRNTAPRKWILK